MTPPGYSLLADSRCAKETVRQFLLGEAPSPCTHPGTGQVTAAACFTDRQADEVRRGADAIPPTPRHHLWYSRNRLRMGNDASEHAGFPETPAHRSKAFPQPVRWPHPAQEGIQFQARSLRFIPYRSLPGFSPGARLNMQPTQDRRILANSCSRTSVQGRPAWGSARNSASLWSRIRRCSAGTGTHSGLAAIRSQSSWTNAMRCSFGAASNSRGTFRFALIGNDYRLGSH